MSRSILMPDALLTPEQVAQLLQLAPITLATWRTRGTGPAFIRISGTCVRYSLAAVNEWLDERAVVRGA